MAGEEAEGVASLTDDVFNDSPEPAQETVQEPTQEAEKAPVTDEGEDKGEESEVAEEAAEEAAEPPSAEDAGLQAALLAERRKRQDAEKELRAIREKQEAPDPEEDPEGYAEHLKRVTWTDRVEASREVMMDVHADYEEKEAVFLRMVRDESGNVIDTGMVAKMNASRNPAKFVYEEAKKYLEAETYRDPAKREALIAAEVAKRTAALEERLAALEGKEPKGVTATQLPNLTRATAAGSNSTPTASSGETVDELFDQ